ncbi:MAG: hypothetical protein P8178_09570, partial [Candidatus Thiodiazotropha sp.]
MPPLSLALSREGRGKVLFECGECFLPGRGIKQFVRCALGFYVPLSLALSRKGRGDAEIRRRCE